ncbi:MULTISPECIES: type I toxin-antitoxin system Fst family toxin [unclassified Staphylococcus]|nr:MULTISPECIES: type I toxin-antitoxin system Fst family toxin [unclassified Staphylococcus]UXR74035.1 type I toxin-antitoxin system Fst family toxin [Staphylococcus sp. IVB6238]UXR76423.1 type I toxin-antitoxin system Fst family toxin [Staphylococcus sp. IVB6233]UXR80550.1 type I toxin-antitoxin system Fst family toxin [Staphylococcus sp. IVB6218]
MYELVNHILITVISGCIVALFAHWLRTQDNKKR